MEAPPQRRSRRTGGRPEPRAGGLACPGWRIAARAAAAVRCLGTDRPGPGHDCGSQKKKNTVVIHVYMGVLRRREKQRPWKRAWGYAPSVHPAPSPQARWLSCCPTSCVPVGRVRPPVGTRATPRHADLAGCRGGMGWLAIGIAKNGGSKVPARRAAPSGVDVARAVLAVGGFWRRKIPRAVRCWRARRLREERSFNGGPGGSPRGFDQATIASTSADSVEASPSSVNSMCS